MPKLLIASENPGKIVEFRALLKALRLELVDPGMLGQHVKVIEQPDSYLENAKRKASAYAETSGLWTIADDSGLEVDALDGAPGALSARLAGPGRSDGDRRIFLLDLYSSSTLSRGSRASNAPSPLPIQKDQWTSQGEFARGESSQRSEASTGSDMIQFFS